MNIWTNEVIDSLENNAFYWQGEPLKRESDIFIINLLKDEIAAGKIILDYACGTGRLYDLLKREGLEPVYIGYDSSEGMIRKAKEKFPDAQFSGKVPSKKADVIVNIDMLQHSDSFEDFKNKAKELSGLAKKVIFHFWYKETYLEQQIVIKGNEFNEIFPAPANIINDIMPLFDEHNITVKLFPDCQPYKTAVIITEKKK